MSLLLWHDYLETGLPRIDEQHRHLVALVNALGPALAGAEQVPEESMRTMLLEVVDYAGYHFRDEEAAMVQAGLVPEALAHHRGTHGTFAAQIARRAGAVAQREAGAGEHLLSMLASWLLLHILGEDQAMARQLRLIERGHSPAEAFARGRGGDLAPDPAALSRALVDVYVQLSRQNGEIRAAAHEVAQQRETIARHNASLEQAVFERTQRLEALAGDLARARDAAQAADQAKSRILATVGHELRTPLNAIAGFTHALDGSALGEGQSRAVREIARAGDRLAEVVDRVLAFASDEAPPAPQPFAPATLLAQAADRARALARARGLEVVSSCDPDLPPTLAGDPAAVSSILRQLVDNAAKFTAHGTIRLSADLAGHDAAGTTVRFVVADTGVGIPAADLSRLFNAFGQLDNSLSRRYGGLGLGLALARKMADRLGGRLMAESRSGKGSRFILEARFLPVAPPPVEDPEAPEAGDWLARWMGRLEAFDAGAVDQLERMPADVRASLADHLPGIDRAVRAYDFDEAVRLLREAPHSPDHEGRVTP